MDTVNYDPMSFRDFYESDLGQKVWRYLTSEDAWIRLKLTTELGHPAVEGIGDRLLEQFGTDIKEDRVKQAIGHMVRSVMEHHGFKKDRPGVKCRKKQEVFVYATRYTKA